MDEAHVSGRRVWAETGIIGCDWYMCAVGGRGLLVWVVIKLTVWYCFTV